ncbi:MAG: ABC transporter ATP-binding protein, partial [Fimbriimonadales bacterium]|nr:ABC transporter ATP-binding protein [Fimbriimonadales bacterium]
MPLLDVRDLRVALHNTEIIRGVSFHLQPGDTLGIVGESGCGKSLTALALLRLLPPGGKITGGQILLNGTDLTKLSEKEMRQIRGKDIAIIFQDPFTSLNPVMRIGDQIAEALVFHRHMSWKEARKEAIKRLAEVKVPAPESTAKKFPHQLSGGQRQRVMSAIAFACHPKILIADEPTTALDVTLQAQILALLKELQRQEGTAVILISHDLGVVGTMADFIAVYYAGKIVEFGSTEDVLQQPAHPYTQALLAS